MTDENRESTVSKNESGRMGGSNKSQKSLGLDLRTRIAAVIAAHEPVTDYDGADGECIECDLTPRWPDAPILPPSDGWKRHAGHMADAVIRELQLTVLGDGIVVGVIHE